MKILNKIFYYTSLFLCITAFLLILNMHGGSALPTLDILLSPSQSLANDDKKQEYEVFGFAPYWTLNKLDNVDFDVLTTLAYFGVPIKPDGNLDTTDIGYTRLHSDKAKELFNKARAHNTKVVLTITLMDNESIEALMDDPKAQKKTINQTVKLVTDNNLDGINVDIEYDGNPGPVKRDQFSKFVKDITNEMKSADPDSKVTVSVYASAAKYPKLYDIKSIAQSTDGIFMMAYDFATKGSDHAMPTAPLNGHKEGKYWYDIETAVNDFLALMPSEKLILGVPYYGYNYSVAKPQVKAATMSAYYRNARALTQTYSAMEDDIKPKINGITKIQEGWDQDGKVSWVAYKNGTGAWRMVFKEDEKSLGIKYDFAKENNLAGVGIWALGFDNGKDELWNLLAEKFGNEQVKVVRNNE
jgi:spore germination protein